MNQSSTSWQAFWVIVASIIILLTSLTLLTNTLLTTF